MRNKRSFIKFTVAGGVTGLLGLGAYRGFKHPVQTVDPYKVVKAAGVLVAATWAIALL